MTSISNIYNNPNYGNLPTVTQIAVLDMNAALFANAAPDVKARLLEGTIPPASYAATLAEIPWKDAALAVNAMNDAATIDPNSAAVLAANASTALITFARLAYNAMQASIRYANNVSTDSAPDAATEAVLASSISASAASSANSASTNASDAASNLATVASNAATLAANSVAGTAPVRLHLLQRLPLLRCQRWH